MVGIVNNKKEELDRKPENSQVRGPTAKDLPAGTPRKSAGIVKQREKAQQKAMAPAMSALDKLFKPKKKK